MAGAVALADLDRDHGRQNVAGLVARELKPDGTCPVTGKRGYRTKHSAVGVLRLIWRTGRRKKLPTNTYLCKHCEHWHLTTKAGLGGI